MHNDTAMESLVQKGKTPLFIETTKVCQEVFTALESISPLTDQIVYTALKNVDFSTKIKKIVKTYMGIDLSQVIVEKSMIPIPFCCFDFPDIIQRTSIKTLSAGTIYASIQRHYNNRDGRVDISYIDKIPVVIDLGVTTSLWIIKNKDGSFYHTAEEIAAFILHELGHADFKIREAYRVAVNTIDASDIINYVTEHPNREVILDLIDHVGKSPYFDKNMLPILTVIRKFFVEANDFNDPVYIEALSTLTFLVASEVSSNNFVSIDKFLDNRYTEVKTSNQLLDEERSADEFSSRNGSYAYLVSALYKARALETHQATLQFSPYMWSSAALVCSSMMNFLALFYLPAENVANGYDPLLRRLSLIVETAKHAFHNQDLPDNVKIDIANQITEAEAYIKQYQSTANFRIRNEITIWKKNIGKFGRVIAAPFQNRLSQDYERLQNSTRSLSRHGLFYLANKK